MHQAEISVYFIDRIFSVMFAQSFVSITAHSCLTHFPSAVAGSDMRLTELSRPDVLVECIKYVVH